MMNWISVKDELPEEKRKVLIYGGGDIHLGILDIREKVTPNGFLLMRSSNGGTLVSHWMPLPEPPK